MNVLDHGFVRLVAKTGHAGLATVNAARLSYGIQVADFKDDDRKLLDYLLSHGHTSPFRHAYFTFHIKAPLFVFRQAWKYQVGSTWREYTTNDGDAVGIDSFDIQVSTDPGCSWNEISGRYKVLEPEFYLPERVRKNTGRQAANEAMSDEDNEVARRIFAASNDEAVENYEMLLRNGTAKELARLVLPPSIYSECVWTVSLQAILHFLDQRLKEDAQFEIREYAQAVLALIKPDLEVMGLQ